MRLGDLFWVKLYEYKKGDHRYDDTFTIMRAVKERLDVELSFLEALELWSYISGCRCAGWLSFENDEDIVEKIEYLFKDNDLD